MTWGSMLIQASSSRHLGSPALCFSLDPYKSVSERGLSESGPCVSKFRMLGSGLGLSPTPYALVRAWSVNWYGPSVGSCIGLLCYGYGNVEPCLQKDHGH